MTYCQSSSVPWQRVITRAAVILGLLFSIPGEAAEFFRMPTTLPQESAVIQGLSDDGSTAVGELQRFVNDEPLTEAFRWQPGSAPLRLGLGPANNGSTALAASEDGSVVVGAYLDSELRWQPYRWTSATGMVPLASAPAAGAQGRANDVSADGSVVVGEYGVPPSLEECSPGPCPIENAGTVRAFRWTQNNGLVSQPLDPSDSDLLGAAAVGVSADGSVMVSRQFGYVDNCVVVRRGVACISFGVIRTEKLPLLTTATGSQLVDIGAGSVVQALSADGSQLVGQASNGTFRWSAASGVETFEFEGNFLRASSPKSTLNANGSVISTISGLVLGGETADLANLLINGEGLRVHGLNFVSGDVAGFSSDGRVIAGWGVSNSTGQTVSYLARLDALPDADSASQLPALVADGGGVFQRALLSAALPLARSTQVDESATLYVTMINDSQDPMLGCAIVLDTPLPVTLDYAPSEPVDNNITGPANQLFDLAPGEVQSFVLGLTPAAEFPSTVLNPVYQCGNTSPAIIFRDLNELTLAASSTPSADILAVSRTVTADGIALLDTNLQAAFAVASLNLGSATSGVRVEPLPTAGLAAFTPTVCETNSASGDCIAAPAASVVVDFDAGEERTFGVFVESSQPIEPLYAIRRVQLRFSEADGQVRANTSVAVVSGD